MASMKLAAIFLRLTFMHFKRLAIVQFTRMLWCVAGVVWHALGYEANDAAASRRAVSSREGKGLPAIDVLPVHLSFLVYQRHIGFNGSLALIAMVRMWALGVSVD